MAAVSVERDLHGVPKAIGPHGQPRDFHRSSVMAIAEVTERLNRLEEHQFITGWRREGRYWWVEFPGAYRWYTLTQIGAWIDGANAMGAAP